MEPVDVKRMSSIAPLFEGMDDTMIRSCLQGNMGRAWADDATCPRAAQIVLGDFCFLAGGSEFVGARLLAAHVPEGYASPELHVVPQHEGWQNRLEEAFGTRAVRYARFALRRKPDGFDTGRLKTLAEDIPPEYNVVPIDAELFVRSRREAWSKDWCSQFADFGDYRRRGLGFAALLDGEPVSGASSYSVYDGGIEIEIDTKREHRRKGLAAACAARLILACMERGLYPGWDAVNRASLALAEKLGYRLEREYSAWRVTV